MSFFPGKGQYINRKSGITKRRVTWRRDGNEVIPSEDSEPCLSCINQRRMEAERENAIPMDDDVVRAAPNSPEADSCRIIIKLSNDEDDDDDSDGDDEVAMDEHDYGSGNGSGADNGNGHQYNYGNGSGVGNGSHSNGNGGDGGNAAASAGASASGSVSGSAGVSASSSAGDSGHGSNVTRQSASGRSDPEPEPVAGPSSGHTPSTSIVNYGASTSGLVPSSFEDEEEGKRPKKKVCAKPMDLDYDDDYDEDSDPNNNILQRIPTPLQLYEGYYFPVDDPSGITQDDWNEAGPSGINAGASTSGGPSGAYQTSDSSFSSSCSHHSLVDRYTHMNISGCEDQTDDECAFSESEDDADDLEDD